MAKNRYDVDEQLEKPFDIKHFKRALVYVEKYKKAMIIAFGLSVIGALVGLSAPLITSHVIDEVIPAHNMKGLSIWSMILVLTILVNLVFIAIRSKIMTRVGQSIVYDIRSDLFEHLQHLPFTYYDDRPHGKILIRVVNYVNSVSDVLSNGLVNLILELVNVMIILFFMFYILRLWFI